jgi:hypothetical protein
MAAFRAMVSGKSWTLVRLGAQELVALRWKHPVKTSYDLGYDLGLFRVYPMSGNLHSYGKHGILGCEWDLGFFSMKHVDETWDHGDITGNLSWCPGLDLSEKRLHPLNHTPNTCLDP